MITFLNLWCDIYPLRSHRNCRKADLVLHFLNWNLTLTLLKSRLAVARIAELFLKLFLWCILPIFDWWVDSSSSVLLLQLCAKFLACLLECILCCFELYLCQSRIYPYLIFILYKDTHIMLLVSLRWTQTNLFTILMVGIYTRSRFKKSLLSTHSFLKNIILSIGLLSFIPQFNVWKLTIISSGLSCRPSNLDTSWCPTISSGVIYKHHFLSILHISWPDPY